MNVKLLKILNNSELNYPTALEKQFPRVLEKIMALWDTPEFDVYLADLMSTTRINRQGFPQDVASDIIYLNMLHDSNKEVDQKNNWAKVLRADKPKTTE